MSFEFTCPFCLNRTRVAEEFLGHSGPCAHCGKPVTMPTRDRFRRLIPAIQTGKVPEQKQPDQATTNSNREDRSLMRALIGISSISLLLVILGGVVIGLPILRRQMSIAACNSDLERMKAIAKALNAYCERYGTYPPPYTVDSIGKPLLSWRVLILPFMGYKDLYDKFELDQSWDSPLHLTLIGQMPREFSSSNSPDAWGSKQSNFALIKGKSTLFPPNGPLGLKHVVDKPTLLVVETLNSGAGWTEPQDIDIDIVPVAFGNTPMQSIGGLHPQVALGIDTDGNSVIIPKSTSLKELEALLTPNGGETNASNDWSLYP